MSLKHALLVLDEGAVMHKGLPLLLLNVGKGGGAPERRVGAFVVYDA